jgi:hypothetical protein
VCAACYVDSAGVGQRARGGGGGEGNRFSWKDQRGLPSSQASSLCPKKLRCSQLLSKMRRRSKGITLFQFKRNKFLVRFSKYMLHVCLIGEGSFPFGFFRVNIFITPILILLTKCRLWFFGVNSLIISILILVTGCLLSV